MEWAKGITPEWMSEQMGMEGVPAAARSPQAAYRITPRYDTGLLTFTLTRSEAQRYLENHPPEGKWLRPTPGQAEGTTGEEHFAHFGLPEPESFEEGVRYGYVCPRADGAGGEPDSSGADENWPGTSDEYDVEEPSDERCVTLHAHEYAPDRTRIYLQVTFPAGTGPLPAG
ncbi:hypothetical protein [Streptomyces chilikensis]|uniref:Uncharacterized protein n=1 Tax=Streptomyces chilikensis TaxID=1194079 RepID=A0ABV3EKQ7_9ACTN